MIGQTAIAIALNGFNGLDTFGDPDVSFQKKKILFTIISTLSNNEQKINVGSEKDFKFSVHGTLIESCHLTARRHVKLWSLNANLLFKEPRQLTKFI